VIEIVDYDLKTEKGKSWGMVPNGWSECTVKDIAAPIKNALVGGPFGSNLVSRDYVDSGVPVIRGRNMAHGRWITGDFAFVTEEKAESLAGNLARPGDLVFTQRGTLGQVAIVPDGPFERYLVSQSQMKLTVDPEKADPLYLYYEFLSPKQQGHIHINTIQVGVPHTNLGILRDTPLRLPSLSTQKAVAGTLGTLDDKIELNLRMNQTLEAAVQAIFKSWFIDFDPVKAKQAAIAAGRNPEPAAMAALSGKLRISRNPADLSAEALTKAEAALDQFSEDQHHQLAQTATLFPDTLVDSEFGLIPEEWEISEIGNEVSIYGGATPSTKNPEFWDGGTFHWATPKDLSNLADRVLLDTERKITQQGVDRISSGQLPSGTVLMSSRAPVGYLAISQVPISINQGFIAMVCDKRLSNVFVLQWAFHNIDQIKQRAGGSTFAEISKKSFRPIKCVVPSTEIVNSFSAGASTLYSQVTCNAQECQTIAQLRDTLLPKLLSGELRVCDAVDVQ